MPERGRGIDNDNAARAAALTVALSWMAETLTLRANVGRSFTCREADAVVQVLRLSGHVEEAATFLVGHAWGDDEVDFDWHHGVTSPEQAREYIHDYLGLEVADSGQARHPAHAAHLEDDVTDSPEVEAMAEAADLVEQGEHEDILLAQEMAKEDLSQNAPLSIGPTDDLNDLLGVEAGQMIAARADADAALANGEVDALAAALERMGVSAEDGPDRLAQALLAAPPAVQRRQLDRIEVLNTLPSDQPAVLGHQRGRAATKPSPDVTAPGHPAWVAAAAVDRPTDATAQRPRSNSGDHAADGVARSPGRPSASIDRRSSPKP
jgi:hypothetical protein